MNGLKILPLDREPHAEILDIGFEYDRCMNGMALGIVVPVEDVDAIETLYADMKASGTDPVQARREARFSRFSRGGRA